MPDTKYCYPDTDVLINKLDIRDLDKLHIFERKLTMLRLLELLDKPIMVNLISSICRLFMLIFSRMCMTGQEK